MNDVATPVVALLYPGDREARDRADPAASRFAPLFDALAAAGLKAVPAVYHDEFADEVEAQLGQVDGVLVWCNPIEGGRRRACPIGGSSSGRCLRPLRRSTLDGLSCR